MNNMRLLRLNKPVLISLALLLVTLIAAFALFLVYLANPNIEPLPEGSKYTAFGEGLPASMEEYWNGDAAWMFLHADTAETTGTRSFFDGTQVKIMDDGTWYLFNRKILPADNYCSSPLETQVRKSLDKGVTWSEPVVIIPHTPGTAYECAATDGDVY